MCGIVAIIASDDVVSRLLAGLKKLEYRGYDSCGIATINNNSYQLLKDIGSIDDVNNSLNFSNLKGTQGIAHTRWATHGGVLKKNAHPLFSSDSKFAIVHNGIITNYEQKKIFLEQHGYKFHSDTDSEVIANLWQYYFEIEKSVEKSFQKMVSELEGCYSIAASTLHDPKKIFGAKYLLPLVIGKSDNASYICSDVLGFLDFTNKAVKLEDNEFVVLEAANYNIYKIKDHKAVKRDWFKIEDSATEINKGEFPHFMLKEIYDEPASIIAALKIDQDKINKFTKKILSAEHTYIIGIGTTYFVAKTAGYLFGEIAGVFATAVSADEFSSQFSKHRKNHSIFISQSGETFDTKAALRKIKESGISTSAIVNAPNSTIAHAVDYSIFQNSGLEVSVVSTKAAVAQLAIIYRLAFEMALAKGIMDKEQVKNFYTEFELFANKIDNILPAIAVECEKIAANWAKYNHFLCLGKGVYYPIALEVSLKIKEVSYIHAEGMPTGFLKHGTLALIDEKTPCLFFMPHESDKYLYESTLTAIEEVKSRGGLVLGFCESKDTQLRKKFDQAFVIPEINKLFYPLYQLIVSQLFAYYLAVTLKRPIDKPRNLAKSVTVP